MMVVDADEVGAKRNHLHSLHAGLRKFATTTVGLKAHFFRSTSSHVGWRRGRSIEGL
jgi:hypothetical protein